MEGAPTGRRATRLARVSGWCFDHRTKVVAGWLVVLVAVLGAAGVVGARFSASSSVPGCDSAAGFAVLTKYFPELGTGGQSGTIVFRARQGVDDPEVRAAMKKLFALVGAGFPDGNGVPRHPGATVISPYSEQGRAQIAREGPLANQVAYAQVNLSADVDDTESGLIGDAIRDHAPAIEGLQVLPGGQYLASVEPPQTELIGLAFAIVVLILAFGSVLAMSLPIAVALGGVGAGIGTTFLLSHLVTVPDTTTFLGMMIGLGVGIDYALFIVTRYRKALHEGRSPRDATVAAMDSAGRAVLVAGTTVMISMLGLVLIGIGWLAGMGIGLSTTVLATMLASTTLLPALFGFAGDRVEFTCWRGLLAAGFAAAALLALGIGRPALAALAAALAGVTLVASAAVRLLRRTVRPRAARPVRQTFAYRWSRTIQRRPWLWLVTATSVLLVLALPTSSLRLGWADEGNFPKDTATRQAYELLARAFGAGFNGPFLITVGPGVDSPGTVQAVRRTLSRTPGVAAVTPPIAADPAGPTAYVMTLIPTTAPQAAATTKLVTHLRDDVLPVAVAGTGLDVHVTGSAATSIDITDYLAERILLFLGAVLALSFTLLLLVFRSLLVAAKAVMMNVMSLAAAYGVVAAVFQWGWGAHLLGIDGGPINPYVPMMLFAIVFGLSMDYEVFLLSRIKEEYDRTGDAATSVADGLASTARMITAAAAIMVVVFASFTLEDIREIKLFGLGLAIAVLLDATLVRMAVVPTTMQLLGDKNWWTPRWLDRLLPHLALEGSDDPRELRPGPADVTRLEAVPADEVATPVAGRLEPGRHPGRPQHGDSAQNDGDFDAHIGQKPVPESAHCASTML
jgi:putative drug exporter of the RND superfamily